MKIMASQHPGSFYKLDKVLRITASVDLVHRSKTRPLRNCNFFRLRVSERESTLSEPLERVDVNHWTQWIQQIRYLHPLT
jgi:hypothetical protein